MRYYKARITGWWQEDGDSYDDQILLAIEGGYTDAVSVIEEQFSDLDIVKIEIEELYNDEMPYLFLSDVVEACGEPCHCAH